MSIARIVRNTVVRRVTLLVLAAVLGWFGMGRAEAHTHPCSDSVNRTCSRSTADGHSSDPSPAKEHCTAFGYGEAGG
jgi:hypothetical protein